MLSDHRLFFQQYIRDFHATGAIAPSSRWLAAALVRYVPDDRRPPPKAPPRRILEVGPGTGAVTRSIVAALGPVDRLDLVELNDRFVEHLRDRFRREPGFAAVTDRVRVLHQKVEDLPHDSTYDAIVSGLPLNNFAVSEIEQILGAFSRLLLPGGTLSFFEYVAVRPARAVVSGATQRQRLRGIGQRLRDLLGQHEFRRECVWRNLPPAWVHHLRMSEPAPCAATSTKGGGS
jgi:phosphatidylethanolamine/phosphatidyl-N-methylethanolamine N-methyltransferase